MPLKTQTPKKDVEKSMTEIRSEYPRMEHPQPEGKLTAEADILLVPAIWSVSAEEIDRYNAELEAYLTAFEKHLQRLRSLQDLRARTLRLDLIIINEGSYPAEDVLIDMHFPDGFRLINEGQLPKAPTAPDAPERPKTELERITQGFRMPDIYPMRDIRSLADVGIPTPRNVSSPDIRRTTTLKLLILAAVIGLILRFSSAAHKRMLLWLTG